MFQHTKYFPYLPKNGELPTLTPSSLQCQSPLVADQLGVVTERAGPACIWCVGCFKCDVCQDPLVDLHYFYKDGELFCGRHHAELLKPRCFACDEVGFVAGAGLSDVSDRVLSLEVKFVQ